MEEKKPEFLSFTTGEFIDSLSTTKSLFGREVIRKWVGQLGERSMKNFRAEPFTKTKLMSFRCFAEKILVRQRARKMPDEKYVELGRQADEFMREIAEFSQNRKAAELHVHS